MKKFVLVIALLLLLSSADAIPDPYDMLRGKQMTKSGGPWLADDQYMYFGDDKDGYMRFNSTSGYVELSGVASGVLTNGGEVGSGNDLTFAGGDSVFNAGLASGAFTTSTGTNTLSGNTVIAGSKTFTTGTGAVAINGDVTIAATKGITKTAGAGNFDFGSGTGTFTTSSGTNTLSGNTVIAGTKTLATGTGAVTINGPLGIASGIDTIAAGGASDLDFSLSSGFWKTGTGAFTINGATTFGANQGIDTTAGTAAFDFSKGTGVFKTSSGTNTISGTVVIAKGKSWSVDTTGGAGAGAFDFSGSTGAFTTSTGTNTLSGNTVISGSKTFTTGTGAVALNGDTAVAAGKKTTVGALIQRTNTSATNITITDTDPDVWLCGNATGVNTQTYILPTAADNIGRTLTFIVKTDPGTNSVILDGEGAETVDGTATKTTTDAVGTMYQLISDGTAWRKISVSGTWS